MANDTEYGLVANVFINDLRRAANEWPYPAALQEISRVLTPAGRAVLLTDDKRLFRASVERTPGLKIVRERALSYSGVTPTAFCRTRIRPRC